MTVKTPTAPDTSATTAPTTSAMCTGFAFEEAGSTRREHGARHVRPRGAHATSALGSTLVARGRAEVGVVARAGDDEHAPVDVQDVDVAGRRAGSARPRARPPRCVPLAARPPAR